MGYLHINNMYKDQAVLLFKQVYAMEKIHGSSAHISWNQCVLTFFAGGESHQNFVAIFDVTKLTEQFMNDYGKDMPVIIYGEVYGGRCQGMSETYGDKLKFIAFDVQVGETWLTVPEAHKVAEKFGLEFVDYALVDATVEALDAERLKESTQAVRNGCGHGKKREGVVVRPLMEMTNSFGSRVISKHKNADFNERKTDQKVVDPSQMQVMSDANAIADEWVTDMRLTHVLDKIFLNGAPLDISKTRVVIEAMVEDVTREAKGEIVDDKNVRNAISKKAATMFKAKVVNQLNVS